MSFNNTTLDISSFFTYNEAINFIHSLNKCNSDKDCPQDSNCISNNCVVTFYCKDDTRCAFYKTICDGKPCKKDLSCKKNDECLSESCNTSCDDYLLSEYASGTFTFNDGYNYFKNCKCQKDIDCPKGSFCSEGDCVGSFYCKEKDENICSLHINLKDGIYYDNNGVCQANEDCLSAACTNEKCERTYVALVSKSTRLFGLPPGESCTRNSDCKTEKCINGVCSDKYNMEKALDKVLFIFGGIILVVILLIICICIFACRIISRKNRK